MHLLTTNFDRATGTVMQKFKVKPGITFEARKSSEIHDRVIFIDGTECWVMGQSIKDAAKRKPAYMAPLPSDVISLKAKYYEDIWTRAVPI